MRCFRDQTSGPAPEASAGKLDDRLAPLAIIWDYDLTLVDTRRRNFNVSRRIVRELGHDPDQYPALRSLADYVAAHRSTRNWQEFYRQSLCFEPEQVAVAGSRWVALQPHDPTPAPFIDGISETVTALAHLPQGIVSQNARGGIVSELAAAGLEDLFACIIGCEEVASSRQKPHPDGLLTCIEQLVDGATGTVLFIGDHETDIICGQRADQALVEGGSGLRVATVAALFTGDEQITSWQAQPDYQATSPHQVAQLSRR